MRYTIEERQVKKVKFNTIKDGELFKYSPNGALYMKCGNGIVDMLMSKVISYKYICASDEVIPYNYSPLVCWEKK